MKISIGAEARYDNVSIIMTRINGQRQMLVTSSAATTLPSQRREHGLSDQMRISIGAEARNDNVIVMTRIKSQRQTDII